MSYYRITDRMVNRMECKIVCDGKEIASINCSEEGAFIKCTEEGAKMRKEFFEGKKCC